MNIIKKNLINKILVLKALNIPLNSNIAKPKMKSIRLN